MPKDLPGFYFDAEKNRYFPIKGPIPGTSRTTSAASSSAQKSLRKSSQGSNVPCRRGIKVSGMLQARELCGNAITSSKRKVNFQEECRKIQASQPTIWRYLSTQRSADGAMEQVFVDISSPDGLTRTVMLLTGGINGTMCLYSVGEVGEGADSWENRMPLRVWPMNIDKQKSSVNKPGDLGRRWSFQMPSYISCISIPRKDYPQATGSALITTLGSATSGGSLYLMKLSEPLEYDWRNTLRPEINEISLFKSTIWAADSNSDGSRAVVGTNVGAALVHTETGVRSWICRSKSDVLSLKFDNSGNIVLCGFRNGAIVTIDARQKPEDLSSRLTRHKIPYTSHKASTPSNGRGQNLKKQWFEFQGNLSHPGMITMPFSISCLALLELYGHYFLASSVDGTIKLYDNRMVRKAAVQSYEGNVNTHHSIQFIIDPSERFIMSGGEDSYLRIWSIKSGEMLFKESFMDAIPVVGCWPGGENHGSMAWVGCEAGIYCLQYE